MCKLPPRPVPLTPPCALQNAPGYKTMQACSRVSSLVARRLAEWIPLYSSDEERVEE